MEEDKYLGHILTESESADLKEAVRKEKERLLAAEKMKAEARKETEPVLNQWVNYHTRQSLTEFSSLLYELSSSCSHL